MIQKSRFQDLIKQENESNDEQASQKEEAMIRLFIEASSEEEIQKIERWLLR